jgi:uncharacterized protein DUF3175
MPRKKENPIQTVKEMLHFHFNKAGKNLPKNRKAVLALAREELRILFGRN